MANISRRGSPQNQSIIIRCAKEDKEAMRMVAASQGTSMSELIRNLLIQNKYIEPYYASDEI